MILWMSNRSELPVSTPIPTIMEAGEALLPDKHDGAHEGEANQGRVLHHQNQDQVDKVHELGLAVVLAIVEEIGGNVMEL